MNFPDAVKSFFSNYFNFKSRSSRSEYWYPGLFLLLGNTLFGIVDFIIFGETINGQSVPGMQVFALVFSLATFIPSIAVSVRRLHDIERSGWWLFISLVPLFGIILLIYWFCKRGTSGENRFGGDPLPTDNNMATVPA